MIWLQCNWLCETGVVAENTHGCWISRVWIYIWIHFVFLIRRSKLIHIYLFRTDLMRTSPTLGATLRNEDSDMNKWCWPEGSIRAQTCNGQLLFFPVWNLFSFFSPAFGSNLNWIASQDNACFNNPRKGTKVKEGGEGEVAQRQNERAEPQHQLGNRQLH